VQGAISYDKTWRVFVNATREDLQGSAGLGQQGPQEGCVDAGIRQIQGLLPGDDLCRLPGGGAHGRRQPRDAAAVHLPLLQVPAQLTTGDFSLGGHSESLMQEIQARSPRFRLDSESYRELRRQVLVRDGWRCQNCGCMQHLQVHHLKFRSQSGQAEERNLITLCAPCHEGVHRKPCG
jgi:hypothetical protein